VFTSLTKEASPVIRYRTRDLTALLPPTARAFRRIKKITGRTDDMLIIRGVNVFPSQIEEHIMADSALAAIYQIHVSRTSHLDAVEVHCELKQTNNPQPDAATVVAIGAQLQQRIKAHIGISASVKVFPANTLPRIEVGKAKRVYDTRAQQI